MLMGIRTVRRVGRDVLLVLTAAVLSALPVAADESTTAVRDAEALLSNAYAKTKSAKTREEFDAILELCQQAAATGPKQELLDYSSELTAWAHNQLGELYAEQAAALASEERHDEAEQIDAKALAEFEAAVKANPDYWKGRHNRGVSLALRGKLEQAVADFGRVVELKPDYANAWFNRGEIYFDLGKYEQALSDYTRVIQLRSDDYDACIRRGHAYFHLRRFGEALADYDRAVGLKPEAVEAIVNRGDAQWNLGQWREAAEDYQKAIKLDNRSGPAYRSAAWLMATCPEAKYRQKELAVQAAQRAVELSAEEDFTYLDTLAAAYANAGQFDQAQETVARAIKIAPADQKSALRGRLDVYRANQPYRLEK